MQSILQLKYRDSGVDTLNNKSHFHNKEFEILHIISGNGLITIKDKIYELKDNTIFFICGKDAHYTAPENFENYIRNKIIFSGEMLFEVAKTLSSTEQIEELFLNGGSAVKLSREASIKVDECFLNLAKNNFKNQNIALFVNLFSIIDIALSNKHKSVERLENSISRVISYINNNICGKLSLEDIANATNTSKYYLCRKFKETVGMTVFKYIEISRISMAKDLLIKTDESVSQIAQKVGFESFAYFSKVFKSYEKQTPTQYRKRSF